jgi:hypothetical protein
VETVLELSFDSRAISAFAHPPSTASVTTSARNAEAVPQEEPLLTSTASASCGSYYDVKVELPMRAARSIEEFQALEKGEEA